MTRIGETGAATLYSLTGHVGMNIRSQAAARVVVATRDRPDELKRCVERLVSQDFERPFEVVVVDDGSRWPASIDGVKPQPHQRISLLRAPTSQGPAAARNAGIAGVSAPIVAFTDDDTEPLESWLRAAVEALESQPAAVGVEGPVGSRPWDPTTEHSVRALNPGHFLTCNIAYRSTHLAAERGFSEAFPFPHCEDLDLGLRMRTRGPIVFAPTMRVNHPPQEVGVAALIRRSRYVASEVVLARRHPTWSSRPEEPWRYGVATARWWLRAVVDLSADGRLTFGAALRAIAILPATAIWATVASAGAMRTGRS